MFLEIFLILRNFPLIPLNNLPAALILSVTSVSIYSFSSRWALRHLKQSTCPNLSFPALITRMIQWGFLLILITFVFLGLVVIFSLLILSFRILTLYSRSTSLFAIITISSANANSKNLTGIKFLYPKLQTLLEQGLNCQNINKVWGDGSVSECTI